MPLNHAATVPLTVIALAAALSAQGLQERRFIPPRITAAELPPLPSMNVVGGGEVLIEALIDRRGLMTRPSILRSTPPFTQFVLDAITRWQFEPARDIDYKGQETTVEMPVTVIAIYRPPILLNAPTVGEAPKDVMKPSGDVAVALSTTSPLYPPNAADGGVVLYEITLDEGGRVTQSRGVGTVGGFESAALDALAKFQFRPGTFRARPVPTTTYVIFGFRPPIGLAPSSPR
jgi:outer membrane biosynthesis protein TonB